MTKLHIIRIILFEKKTEITKLQIALLNLFNYAFQFLVFQSLYNAGGRTCSAGLWHEKIATRSSWQRASFG